MINCATDKISTIAPENLVDHMDEIVYVSDINTYDMLYLNCKGKTLCNITDDTYTKYKCYELLQGFDEPCSFCMNKELSFNSSKVWELYNPHLKMYMLLKGKLIPWNGRDAHIGLAVDVSNHENKSNTTFYSKDPLTGLYEKNTFYSKAKEILDLDPKTEYAITCFDIERFKLVNDLFGIEEGDRLLIYIAEQIKKECEKFGGMASRLSADVFAILRPFEDVDMDYFEQNIFDWIRNYPLNMEINVAIGVYQVADYTIPVSLMCDRAILALNSVKGNYLTHLAMYNHSLRDAIIEEQELMNEVELAMARKEIKVYLQPKCDMRTGKIVGSEALVRWEHPTKGMILPSVFIPVFERNRYILKLDAYVWEEVCKLLRRWIDSGNTVLPVSVNVSRMDIYEQGLHKKLIELVRKYKLSPSLLELEITESAYTNTTYQVMELANILREQGFVVLMDDFGSGYSSLNMLKDVNVDILKLDMKFLGDGGERSENILESVVRLAKWLDLRVIAEGVETKEQIDFLLGIGGRYAQGYYFYRPMPPETFEQLLLDPAKVDHIGILTNKQRNAYSEDILRLDTISNMIFNGIIGGVVIYKIYQGNLMTVQANQDYYKMTGTTAEDLETGQFNPLEYVASEDIDKIYDAINATREHPSDSVEIQIRRYKKDGDLIWLQVRLFILTQNVGGEIFYASLKDITKQIKAEEELCKLKEQLYHNEYLHQNE